MKHKGLSRVLSLLLALVLLLGLTPAGAVTAFAAGGVAADSKWGANGKLLFTVDEIGRAHV